MNLRSLTASDISELKLIHDKHFSSEFNFPDFTKFFGTFCILDDDERIILAGGCKPLMEAILITDKDRSVKERKEALLMALSTSEGLCNVVGDNQLHAFVKDEFFAKHLRKYGFKNTSGESLVLTWQNSER